MRIINNTSNLNITLTDIDKGHAAGHCPSVYEEHNAKFPNVVHAGQHIDVPDSDKVLLSAAKGQIKTWKTATYFLTEYSMTSNIAAPYVITGANNGFIVNVDGFAPQAFVLPTGVAVTSVQVVGAINPTASGFAAEAVGNFIVLHGPNAFSIGAGTANGTIGFTTGNLTKGK